MLAPDIGFIIAARIPPTLPGGFVPFAPDLAVEVVSPGNTKDEIHKKVELYLRYGTRLVWIVDPKRQSIQVYQPNGADNQATVTYLGIANTLDGAAVLPGFTLPLRELFAA